MLLSPHLENQDRTRGQAKRLRMLVGQGSSSSASLPSAAYIADNRERPAYHISFSPLVDRDTDLAQFHRDECEYMQVTANRVASPPSE
jgi:hypothetical protein